MRLNKILNAFVIYFFSIFLSINIFANEQININFKNLEIEEFAKDVAQILNKNILFNTKIKGKIDFKQNKPIYIDDLLGILIYTLESKGYTIIENKGILRVIRLSDAAKYNPEVYNNNSTTIKKHQMVTEVFNVRYSNVDYISSKIRHLISKSAKLVTDKESNAIVLTDFPANIDTIKEVISIVTKNQKKYIEIVKLKNLQGSTALANLKNVAKAIFNEKIEKEKVSIVLNKDTNAIMFVGKDENVTYLVEYLKDIDSKGSLVEKSVEVTYLKNSESKDVIKILNGVISQKIYKDKNNKPFASANEVSNSIILMGPKNEIEYFSKLIEKLDIDRAQVFVQARIIEVNEGKIDNLGIQYGLSNLSIGGLVNMASKIQEKYENINPVTGATSYIDKGISLNGSTIAKGLALGATINLLKSNQAVDIVSEPSLLCINNKESSIYVGETKTYQTGSTTTTGGNTNNSYKREDVGLKLKLKPRISSDNKVTLDINVVVEDAKETTGTNPDTSKKDIKTTAIVNNGESIVLGGYIKSVKDKITDKVPLLGDIPLLGRLFRNEKDVNSRINLVMIITPYIIPTTSDLTSIRQHISGLKSLEDKYTKDLKVKLEQRKLKAKLEEKEREEEIKELQSDINALEDEDEIF
jgi:general secretion pathway protein D